MLSEEFDRKGGGEETADRVVTGFDAPIEVDAGANDGEVEGRFEGIVELVTEDDLGTTGLLSMGPLTTNE